MAQAETQGGHTVRQRIQRIVSGAHLLVPLLALGLALLLTFLAATVLVMGFGEPRALVWVLGLSSLGSLLALLVGLQRLRAELIEPLARLEESVSQVCAGEPGATLSLDDTGVLGAMISDLDSSASFTRTWTAGCRVIPRVWHRRPHR